MRSNSGQIFQGVFFVIQPLHCLRKLNSNLLSKTLDLMTGNNVGDSSIHCCQQQTQESLFSLKVPPEIFNNNDDLTRS